MGNDTKIQQLLASNNAKGINNFKNMGIGKRMTLKYFFKHR